MLVNHSSGVVGLPLAGLPYSGDAVALPATSGVPEIDYADSPVALTEGDSSGTYSPSSTGGDPATAYALTTGALPYWLSFSTTTGVFTIVSAIPFGSAATLTFGVTPSNGSGSGSEATLELDISLAAPVVEVGNQTRAVGRPARVYFTNLGGFPTSASLISGTLPSGLSLDTDGTATGSVGAIYGTPITLETKTGIVLRGTNATGSDDTPAFSIRIKAAPGGGGGSHFRSSSWR